MASYLVTGGAGFIGSHVARRLAAEGERVRVIDNLSTGSREALRDSESGIEFIEGDLTDPAACARAVRGIDFVIHAAAIPSVQKSVDDPAGTSHANVIGTVRLLDACRAEGVRRVVYSASSSAYGERAEEKKSEELTPETLSPYAAAKLAGEHFCRAFHASYGLETVALRYFNVFGPGQDPSSPYSAVIPLFIAAVLEGRSPVIYGDGGQSRDFTYIDNVVEANLLAARADGSRIAGRVINVACGRAVSLLDVLASINRALGMQVRPVFAEPRAGDIRHSLADITLARELLGYEVSVGFDEGLRRTIEWYRTPAG